jgi:hypothetical protein
MSSDFDGMTDGAGAPARLLDSDLRRRCAARIARHIRRAGADNSKIVSGHD